jgi:hypothetical protein
MHSCWQYVRPIWLPHHHIGDLLVPTPNLSCNAQPNGSCRCNVKALRSGGQKLWQQPTSCQYTTNLNIGQELTASRREVANIPTGHVIAPMYKLYSYICSDMPRAEMPTEELRSQHVVCLGPEEINQSERMGSAVSNMQLSSGTQLERVCPAATPPYWWQFCSSAQSQGSSKLKIARAT